MLRRAQDGDTRAFEALVTPLEGMVWRVCFHMMGNTADAEDAAQDAMLRAWRGLPGYNGRAEFSSWLYRVAVTACLDALRRRKARPAASLDALGEAGFDPPDAAPLPEEAVLHHERQEDLRRALSRLPEDQRVPLVLYAVEGRPYEEIGELLGLPAGTVKSRISRAREKLSELFDENGNKSASAPSNKMKGGR